MKYRIKMAKFYQAVIVEGHSGSVSSFTPDDLVTDAASRRGFAIEETERGVYLYTKGGARTLVTWANIAYIQYLPIEEVKIVEPPKPAKAK